MRGVSFLGSNPYVLAAQLEALALDLRALAGGMPPDLTEAPRLEGWRMVKRSGAALVGTVTGHPRIADGRPSFTSEIFAFNADKRWARTLSRFYTLGEGAPLNG